MKCSRTYRLLPSPGLIARDQRGLSLLEVLLSTVIMGIALAGFLMALSTSSVASRKALNENQLVYLASIEFEALRSAPFEEVAFLQTGDPGFVQEVPDYFHDLAISENKGGNVQVGASGDLLTGGTDYSRDMAFDGKRANENSRWMGVQNLPAYDPGSEPGGGGPGGGGPGGGEPGGEPGGGGDYAPDDFQYIFCSFPELTRISRILYDNRFNVSEVNGAPTGDFDYLPHEDDVWQRGYTFFWSDKILGPGEVFDPWRHANSPIAYAQNQGYGSTDVQIIYNKPQSPLEAGIIGIYGIDTYSDFDVGFHWPYVSEVEVYGYSQATYYLEEYYRPIDGEGEFDNIIMYFPDYLGSGFDMGRRTYVVAPDLDSVRKGRRDLIRVEIEFYPTSAIERSEEWQSLTWWSPEESNELARFQTSFYRDIPTRIDRLPNLKDFPTHVVYDDGEDLRFSFTVPDASEIRGYWGVFDLGANDTVTVEDGQGNIIEGPYLGDSQLDNYTAWVPGDTLVIHFVSQPPENTYDDGKGGFRISDVEIRKVGLY
jgi:prepilin-type N-terminal cleavage/methylation domain-containing protein